MTTSNADLNCIANHIWGIADDVLRDLYVRGKYRDVILPMTVLRRFDAVLEGTKQAVLDMKAVLDEAGVVEQQTALRAAAGQAFYNTSKFTLRDLRARASRQRLEADFRAWLDGFSPNVQDILESFEFRNQIPRLSKADALGTLIEKLTSPDINLSPAPLKNHDGSVRHPGCGIPGRSPMSSRASSDVREASAGLPKLDPLAAEEGQDGDSNRYRGSEASGEAEEGAPLTDVVEAERSEPAADELMAEGR